MAQNISLLGANYPDVPAVTLPITGGGTATFSDTRSITYNLSGGASASVTPSEVVAGQGFSLKLKAPTGYNLNNVTVTMGGNDITSQVFTPDEAGGGSTLITKSIGANGTYNASSDNADGYSSVTVSVQNTYATGDEGKVVSNGALVAQGSDTVTTNGTVDTTLISSLLVNVPSTSAVKSGTITPASATKSMSFNSELSSIKGIIILPTATPLISTRTQVGLICMPTGAYYKSMSLYTNSAGTSLALSGSTSNTRFTISGTTVTVTGQYNFQPTVGYIWYAW